MAPEKYDLIVIGSGPAGEKGAAKAAYFGKRVAIIEKEAVLGGAAANTGTIPSKTLRETALFLSSFRQRELYGLRFTFKEKVTVRDFLARERLVREHERARVHENLKRHHIITYTGTASFIDAHTVAVKAPRCPPFPIQGDVILLATGSYPYRPLTKTGEPIFPFHDPRVHDSDTILTLHEIPQSMLVVGGGVIGGEYACTFAALGVKVTLVEKRERLLEFLDEELAEALRAHMAGTGIHFLMPDDVVQVTAGEQLQVRLRSGAALAVDAILVSSGRCGNTEGVGVEKVGVKTDERGRVLVNEQYQTSVPHIIAAGDVIGNPALASTSMEQARLAVARAFNLDGGDFKVPILPYGIYTIPECSMAGETEDSLQKKKVAYVAGKALYANNARGQIIGDSSGFLKLLFRREDMKLVGVHVIGEQAAELVHVGLTAMMVNADVQLFIQTCYNYPTLTELYKYAAYDALGKAAR